jgi:hypothetical protein
VFAAVCVNSINISVSASVYPKDPEALEQKAAYERLIQHISIQGSDTPLMSVASPEKPLWPSSGPITSPYGWRIHPIYGDMRFHYGLDIGVGEGTRIVAPMAGRVSDYSWSDSVGFTVEIDHGGGVFTRYLHLKGSYVNKTQNVAKGELIALSGNTGYLTTGPHLHFEVYEMNNAARANYPYYGTVDPQTWLMVEDAPPPTAGASFAMLEEIGAATAMIRTVKSVDGAMVPKASWYSGANTFDPNKAKMATGDFNADGFMDIVLLYDYGGSTARLWTLLWNGKHYDAYEAWFSGVGAFDCRRARLVGGNFDADARGEIALLYDYGGATARLWLFDSTENGRGFTQPQEKWMSSSGGFDANRANLVAGDFNGSGPDEVGVLYDYGSTARFWAFLDGGSGRYNAVEYWLSGPGAFDAGRTKITAGDFGGGSHDDLAILYDYGNSTARFWTLISNGSRMATNEAWFSLPGNFSVNQAAFRAGSFDSVAKDDIALVYDYGNATTRIWRFGSDGAAQPRFSPVESWYSGFGGFDSRMCRLE